MVRSATWELVEMMSFNAVSVLYIDTTMFSHVTYVQIVSSKTTFCTGMEFSIHLV